MKCYICLMDFDSEEDNDYCDKCKIIVTTNEDDPREDR